MSSQYEKMLIEMYEKMLNGIEKELPSPSYEFGYFKDVFVEMSDGIKLMTRLFFPKGDGPWPVILVRNPYLIEKALKQVQLPWFTKFGYVVVYQQVRGTLDSEGEWLPFEHERKDGLDTVMWIVEQKWMNGNIGTFGGSYLGHVQWSIADQVPPELKTMYFSVYGGESYEHFYMNGMFRQGLWARWTAMMMEPRCNNYINPLDNYQKALQVKPHIGMDQ